MSSRKIEQATYDDVSFRFLAADGRPVRDTIASFRQRQHAQSDELRADEREEVDKLLAEAAKAELAEAKKAEVEKKLRTPDPEEIGMGRRNPLPRGRGSLIQPDPTSRDRKCAFNWSVTNLRSKRGTSCF